jgi:hypothetical protein
MYSKNEEDKTVTVEPLVTMESLATHTLKYGYLPRVVPEFRKITVGGAINGCGKWLLATSLTSCCRSGEFLFQIRTF